MQTTKSSQKLFITSLEEEGAPPDPHDFSFSAWPCRFIVGSHENVLNDFRDGVVVCTLQPACREFAAIIALPRRQASRVLLTNIF